MYKIKLALVNLIIAISVTAIATTSYIAFTHHKNEYNQSITTSNKNLRRLTRVVSGSAELNFLTIDQTLRSATDRQYLNLLFGGNLHKDMEKNLALWVKKTPHIDAMLFTDENGIVDMLFRKGESTFDIKSGYLFSAQDHFNYHKEHPEQELLISMLQKSEDSLNGRIFISRRVENVNGEFGGLVVAIIDSNYLTNLVNSVDIGQSTEIYLLLNDDDLLAGNIPDSNSKLALLKAMIGESGFDKVEEGEIVIAERTINDSLNMFSFQKIPGLPIMVAMIAKESDIFATWRESRNYYFGLIAIFTIFIVTIVSFTIMLAEKVVQAKASENRILHASRAKSDFLAKMSHELRTPLNAVIGFSEMLSSGYFGKVNHMQVERLNDINMCGNHLLELISDILEFSKGEANKLRLNEEDTDLYNISRQACRIIEQRAKKKGVEVINNISREAPILFADSRKLKQIILNLLSNSIKFTNAGGKIMIATYFDKDKNFVVAISDTGIGIAPEDIPKAMTVFEQVHKDKNNEGTGLGLPLCKMLIELHGGKLNLESKVNVGTKASIILPAARVQKIIASEYNNALQPIMVS